MGQDAEMGPATGSPFDWSSQWMKNSGNAMQGAMMADPTQLAQNYQNPYQQQVIDRTMTNMGDMNSQLINQVGANATSAGAFGGDRHGLVEATQNAETVQNMGDMAANLNLTGYDNSMNNAFRQLGNVYQGAQGLQGAAGNAFNTGQSLLGMQQQQGDIARGVSQGVMDDAGQIAAGNDPNSVLGQLQSILGGNPLGGNASGTASRTPSGAEKLGAVTGGIGDILGMGK